MKRSNGASARSHWALALLGLALFAATWHLLTLGNGKGDVPGPWLTLRGLEEIASGGVLWRNIAASVFRVGWGFTLAALAGIPLGVLLGWHPSLRSACNPIVQCLRPISPIAWLPIAGLIFGGAKWFDASDLSAIFLIFLTSFFPIVTATTAAVATVDRKYLRSAANFGVRGFELFRRVLLPAAMPQILTGLRLALGIAWVVVVAAEMLGVQSGLGFQVNDSRNILRMDLVTAAMVVIGLIGLLLDGAMARLERASLARRGAGAR